MHTWGLGWQWWESVGSCGGAVHRAGHTRGQQWWERCMSCFALSLKLQQTRQRTSMWDINRAHFPMLPIFPCPAYFPPRFCSLYTTSMFSMPNPFFPCWAHFPHAKPIFSMWAYFVFIWESFLAFFIPLRSKSQVLTSTKMFLCVLTLHFSAASFATAHHSGSFACASVPLLCSLPWKCFSSWLSSCHFILLSDRMLCPQGGHPGPSS